MKFFSKFKVLLCLQSQNKMTSTSISSMTDVSRSNYESFGDEFVRIIDSSDGLDLLNSTGSQHPDPAKASLLDKCRGLVFHGDKLVMGSFPHTPEKTLETLSPDDLDLENMYFLESHEGTIIRMFHFENRWYISTHRKLDAYSSRWNSPESFGELFEKCVNHEYTTNQTFKDSLKEDPSLNCTPLESFQNSLDKSYQYMFLIRNHNQNRIVCDGCATPTMYHVGTFSDGELVYDKSIEGLKTPKKYTFNSFQQVKEKMDSINYKELQGLVVFSQRNAVMKIMTSDYKELFDLRGNESSLRFRYLQIRGDVIKVQKYLELYPDFTDMAYFVEDCLLTAAKTIHDSYVSRHIHKNFVTLPKTEYIVSQSCHRNFLETMQYVTINTVLKEINKLNAVNLNMVLKNIIKKPQGTPATNPYNVNVVRKNVLPPPMYPPPPQYPTPPPPQPRVYYHQPLYMQNPVYNYVPK